MDRSGEHGVDRRFPYGSRRLAQIDTAKVPSNIVPLLADGGVAKQLATPIGNFQAGLPTVGTFTRGPVHTLSLKAPDFEEGKPRTGPNGWWSVWRKTRQDYRGFAPIHRGECNVLMADGSVQSFEDMDKDGYLNNGFMNTPENGYETFSIELSPEEFSSVYSLTDSSIP